MSKAKTKPKAKKPAAKPKAKPKSKAAKSPKEIPPWATEEALALYDFDTQKVSTEIAKDVEDLLKKWTELKSKASNAKKQYEGRNAELIEYVEERSEQRGKPPSTLFSDADRKAAADERKKDAAAVGARAADAMDKAKPKGKESKSIPFDAAAAPADAWFPDDLWKSFPIDRLKVYGMTDGDIKVLHSGETKNGIEGIGPIDTIGRLSKFCEPKPGSTWNRTYKDLKGFGAAAVDRLQNAHDSFWSAWRKGLDAQFAVEMGFTKPDAAKLKIHEPGADDGDDTTAGSGSKRRKPKGQAKPDAEATEPLDASAAIDAASEKILGGEATEIPE